MSCGAVRGDGVEWTPPVTDTIRIMTWNVHGTFNLNPRFDLDCVRAIIEKWAPDIVALQEVDRRFGSRLTALDPELIESHTDYQAISFSHRPQSLGYHGNVVLARKSMTVTSARPMVLPHLEPRGAAVADLTLGG